MTHCISNKRIREKALRNESLETNNARDCSQSCGYLSKWTSFLPFRVQLKDVSNRVQKWNVGPEHRKGRETFRGCFGKRTPFLRLRAQLHQDVSLPIQLHKIKERTSANLLMSFFVFYLVYCDCSHLYFCANMVTNLILIRLPFSSVLCSWPKSSLYLCNVQPA